MTRKVSREIPPTLQGAPKSPSVHPGPAEGSRRCSWFDKLTTNGFRRFIRHPLRISRSQLYHNVHNFLVTFSRFSITFYNFSGEAALLPLFAPNHAVSEREGTQVSAHPHRGDEMNRDHERDQDSAALRDRLSQLSEFLKTSELTETRAFVHSFVKEIEVKPGRSAIVYSLLTPEDSPISGGDVAEVALNGGVRSSVRYGDPPRNETNYDYGRIRSLVPHNVPHN